MYRHEPILTVQFTNADTGLHNYLHLHLQWLLCLSDHFRFPLYDPRIQPFSQVLSEGYFGGNMSASNVCSSWAQPLSMAQLLERSISNISRQTFALHCYHVQPDIVYQPSRTFKTSDKIVPFLCSFSVFRCRQYRPTLGLIFNV